MLLWARAAGDRVPYTMCSVISSLLLGPLLSPSHSAEPGLKVGADAASGGGGLLLTRRALTRFCLVATWTKLIADYISRAHAIPLLPIPVVDCRDVAVGIAKLVSSHDTVCGRVFMSGESTTSVELVSQLRLLYPGFTWPSREVPRWALSPLVGVPWKMSRKGIKERYGRRYSLSTRRAVSEVGIKFRCTTDTLRDTVESLHSNGIVDLHAKKSSTLDAGARLSSRLSNVGLSVRSSRRAASGRV
jgi:hypothetical protein